MWREISELGCQLEETVLARILRGDAPERSIFSSCVNYLGPYFRFNAGVETVPTILGKTQCPLIQ
jgi:hypothetical protein